jgi:predicted transcriptional regulator
LDAPISPDLESELSRLAQHAGLDAGNFAAGVLRDFVEHDAEIRAAVRRGVEQADRGELLDHAEVVERIE